MNYDDGFWHLLAIRLIIINHINHITPNIDNNCHSVTAMLTVGPTCSDAGLRPLPLNGGLPSTSTFDETCYEDHIEAVSEPLSCMDSISPLVSLLALCYKCRVPAEKLTTHIDTHTHDHDHHAPDRLSTLMNTMAQSPECSTHRHEEMHNSFIRLLSPILSGFAGQSDFAEAVGAFSAPDEFRDFWTFQGRNLIRDFVQGEGGGRGTRGSELPFVPVFVSRPSYRIALTRDHRGLLLVPGKAQAGDAIFGAIVSGENRHFVVRRQRGNVKRTIGEAFTSD